MKQLANCEKSLEYCSQTNSRLMEINRDFAHDLTYAQNALADRDIQIEKLSKTIDTIQQGNI